MIELTVFTEVIECVPDSGHPETPGICPVDTRPLVKTIEHQLELNSRTAIGLNKSVMDLMKLDSQSGEFSYDFSLSMEESNKAFFTNFGKLNVVGKEHFKTYRARLKKDSNVVFEGRLLLILADTNRKIYKVRLISNLSSLNYVLQDKKVSELEYFKPFIHEFNGVETIKTSWRGTLVRGNVPNYSDPAEIVNPNKEFIYPLQDFQGLGYYHNENVQDDGSQKYVPFHTAIKSDEAATNVVVTPFDASLLSPAFKFMPIIQHIFSENGFEADLSYYDDERWNNLYVQTPPYVEEPEGTNEALAYLGLNDPMNVEVSVGNKYPKIELEAIDGDLFIVNSAYIAPVDGDYEFEFVWDTNFTSGTGGDLQAAHLKIRYAGTDLISKTYIGENVLSGSQSMTITMTEGESIYMQVSTAWQNPNSSQKANIVFREATKIEVISTPEIHFDLIREVEWYFQDTTQLEMLAEFLSMSKGIIDYPDKSNEKSLLVAPMLKLWLDNAVPQMDITDKIDRSEKFEIRPATELMPRKIEFKWADSDDHLATTYKAMTGIGFGDTKLIKTALEYAGTEFTYESKMQSYITGAVQLLLQVNNSNDSNIIIPSPYKDVNKFDKSNYKLRPFLWDGTVRYCMPYYMNNLGNVNDPREELDHYPMCHNMLLHDSNGWIIDLSTIDTNWESSKPFHVPGTPPTVAFNLFDQFYKGYIDSLYFPDSIIIDTAIKITPNEFSGLNLYAPVVLDNSFYRILNYRDYDVVGDNPMKILLMKDNIFKPFIQKLDKVSNVVIDSCGIDIDELEIIGSYDAVENAETYHIIIFADGVELGRITSSTLTFSFRTGIPGGEETFGVQVYASTPGWRDGDLSDLVECVYAPPGCSLDLPTGMIPTFARSLTDEHMDFTATWDAVVNAGAYSLRFYLGNVFQKEVIGVTGTTHTETIFHLDGMKDYYFEVKSTDDTTDTCNDSIWIASSVISVPGWGERLDEPIFTVIDWNGDESDSIVSATWDAVTNAEEYLIEWYSNGVKGGETTVSGTSVDIEIALTSIEQHIYLTAIAKATGWGQSSAGTSNTITLPAIVIPLDPPTNVNLLNDITYVLEGSWDAVTEAVTYDYEFIVDGSVTGNPIETSSTSFGEMHNEWSGSDISFRVRSRDGDSESTWAVSNTVTLPKPL